MAQETSEKKWFDRDLSERFPIMGSQVERVGVWRALVGAGSMYWSIPMFFAVHVAGLTVMGKWILGPLLGLKDLEIRNYIVLDRHKIAGLHSFDKFNCLFCGYANGISMLLHARLEQLGNFSGMVPFWKKAIIGGATVLLSPVFLAAEFNIQFLYNLLITRSLGMKRMSIKESYQEIEELEYAEHLRRSLAGKVLRYQKSIDLRLENSLEQIESSWCPLKHLDDGKDKVYPKHHENFFEPDQIEQMKETLKTVGTVSDTKPYK